MKELKTERLHFRKIKMNDASRIFNCWASDDEVTKYLTWNTEKSIDEAKEIISIWLKDYENEGCFRYGIELLGTNELIGMIDAVNIDGYYAIGYVLGREYWNKGYMSEALKWFVSHLLNEGYHKIMIKADVRNIASNRVIEKCGFEFLKCEKEPRSKVKPEIVSVNYYIKSE